MGYALIVGGGTDGRYTISLDIGEAERASLVARFTTAQAAAQANVAAAQAELNTKTAELDAATTAYNDATILYIELLRNEAVVEDEDAYLEIVKSYFEAQATYLRARAAHSAALANKNALEFSASHLTKALAAWQAQVLTETREAWCTDFTEDATGYVATLEIPGESDRILIAPGGRSPVLETDGYLRSRGLMSPWQAYFNAAILPGWQKFKPTYRWGTITALDEDADTATVALAEARSSAQRLLVNQATTLANVQVVYMDCNAEAFEVGDRVVVEFQGQDWSAPRIVGFVDNPVPCIPWPEVYVEVTQTTTLEQASAGSKDWFDYEFYVNAADTGTLCGTSGFLLGTLPDRDINGQWWEFGAYDFTETPPEGFSVSVDNPPNQLIGTGMSGLPTNGMPPDATSNFLYIQYVTGGIKVSKKEASFAQKTLPVYGGPVGCVIDTYETAFGVVGQLPEEYDFWSNSGWTTTIIAGPAPLVDLLTQLPAVSVTRDGRTIEYEYNRTESISAYVNRLIFSRP